MVTERQNEILNLVVDIFTKTHEPVSYTHLMILLLFFVVLLYLILTLAIILLNRRFPFDRLAGAEYESTVRVKKELLKDETESSK